MLLAPAPGGLHHHPGLGNLTIPGVQQLALPPGSSYDEPGPEPDAEEGPQAAWGHCALLPNYGQHNGLKERVGGRSAG